MKLGDIHGSPDIYLTAEESPGKPQLINSLMKSVRQVIASNGFLYLRITVDVKISYLFISGAD